MKLLQSLAGKKGFSLSARKLMFAGGMASVLLSASGARADVVKTFDLNGDFQFPAVRAFTGTLVFDFTHDALDSLNIVVDGLPAYNLSPSLHFAGKEAIVDAFDSSGDMLTLMFATSQAGSLKGFVSGAIFGGDAPISNQTGVIGVLINASGSVVLDPPSDPGVGAAGAVPETSTWAMMLLGLMGLGFAAKAKRGSGFASRA
jgi:hypothetical protein